jgi:hypothetical protein
MNEDFLSYVILFQDVLSFIFDFEHNDLLDNNLIFNGVLVYLKHKTRYFCREYDSSSHIHFLKFKDKLGHSIK